MKGDFSRDTFHRRNHYRRVLMQQGRVEVDADANEQIGIDAHITGTTTIDVVGQSGVPMLPDGTPANGFKIQLDTTSGQLTVGKGHMYVGGLLVENDLDHVFYLTQPDRPGLALANDPDLAGDGIYVVYLDVWERLIIALDDPLIRETALGGPDHAVRARVVWQVKLAKVGDLNAALTCATTGNGWIPASTTGTLAASTAAPVVNKLPCILPPETGYRRLENQLYRVEIHEAGGYGTATFKWSRENGSVVAGVLGNVGGGSVVGPSFLVTTTGRDASLGFAVADYVELIDDQAELLNGRGQLLQVKMPDPTNLTITTTEAAASSVDPKRHAKLRRWDQTGPGLAQGVPIPDGTPIALEEGIQVAFSNGTFNTGDYWIIPARTKSRAQGGHIEWPVDAGNAVSLPPHGVRHHYGKLALIGLKGNTFQLVDNQVPDCRPCFPPLTQIQPSHGASPCTLVVQPGPGWEKQVLALFAQKSGIDAEICFPAGDFPVTKTVAITDAGDIKISGAGFGTKLVGQTLESVMSFTRCTSVTVSDLAASTTMVDPAPGPSAKGPKPFDKRDHINGTLEFIDCPYVAVEDVSLRCGGGKIRGAACLTVRSTIGDANAADGLGAVRVKCSRFAVGEMQYGILLVHVARAIVEDNEITLAQAPAEARPPIADRLRDPLFLSMARNLLVSRPTITAAPDVARPAPPTATTRPTRRRSRTAGATIPVETVSTPAAPSGAAPSAATPSPPAASPPPSTATGNAEERSNVTVNIAGRVVSFRSYPELQTTWQAFFDQNAPRTLATDRDVMNFVSESANRVLTDATARQSFASFGDLIHLIGNQDAPVAARGIAVGGRTIRDLHIRNNSISGTLQAITVGMSHQQTLPLGKPDRAGSVSIVGNVIDVVLNALARKSARHAIFVGNVDSLQIEQNRASLSQPPGRERIAAEGIRVFGYLGRKMIVRHNHLSNFSLGIRVNALLGPGRPVPGQKPPYEAEMREGNLWLIADNIFEGSSPQINSPGCMIFDNWH